MLGFSKDKFYILNYSLERLGKIRSELYEHTELNSKLRTYRIQNIQN